MLNKTKIIFRCDGNEKMGLGHIFRSSALAEILSAQFTCIWVTRCEIDRVVKTVQSNYCEVFRINEYSIEQESAFMISHFQQNDLIILDGYHFDLKYQEDLAMQGFEFACIDDIHAYPFLSKIIINHSGGFTPQDYKSLPDTQFYLGPRYALLRKPFLEAVKYRRNGVKGNRCLICFGGADPHNNTLQVLKSRKELNAFSEIHVITGSAYAYQEELQRFAKHNSKIRLHHSLDTSEMIEVMKQCSYAVLSPSTIVYEYLTVGGIVFLEQIADNQKDVIRYFVEEGLAFTLERMCSLTDKEIKTAFEKAAAIFDGQSGTRLAKIFRQYFDSRELKVRKAKAEDARITFEWANDPEVRQQSYNQNEIQWEQHTQWFNNRLTDASCHYYIFELAQEPVAQIRFQLNDGKAVLGYLAGGGIRSKGLGTSILAKGIAALTSDISDPLQIIGYVKKSNVPSQRSFEKLAFRKEETTDYPDSYKYTMNYGD